MPDKIDSGPASQQTIADAIPLEPVDKTEVTAAGPLRINNFRLLLTGSVLSNAVMWIMQITLSWLVYDITGSGTLLGTINLTRSAAGICMATVAGLLVDRLNRRKLITIENSVLFATTFLVGLSIILGHQSIAVLFIFAIVNGSIVTLDGTLRQVLIFDLVPRRLTPNAVAILQTGWSLMRVIGPSIGGLLIVWISAGGNFLIMAGAYVLIAFTILQIKFPKHKATTTSASPLKNIKDGFTYIKKERLTRTFMILGFIMPFLTVPIFTILPPIYAVKVFGDESGRTLGFLLAAVGVGGIMGGVVTTILGRFEHRGRLQLLSLFIVSASLIGFAFTTNLPVALLTMVAAGFGETIFISINQTLIQLSIPDHLRGRVTAMVYLTNVVSPMGSMLAGTGSDLFGGPKMITIIMAGTAAVISIFIYVFVPTIRNYRLSQGIAAK